MKRLLSLLLCLAAPLSTFAEDIVTTTGAKYTNVTISRAEPDGLVIMTDAGIEKIPFAILPPELQTRYGYDPKRAAQFSAQTQAAAAQRQAEIDSTRKTLQTRVVEEASLRKQLDTVSQRPAPGTIGTPGVHVLRVSGTVLQVFSKAILMGEWESQTLDPYTDKRGIVHGGAQVGKSERLVIVGVDSKYVDGSQFSGVIYPAGRTSYTSVQGARKTALRYATSPEIAVQLVNSKQERSGGNQ